MGSKLTYLIIGNQLIIKVQFDVQRISYDLLRAARILLNMNNSNLSVVLPVDIMVIETTTDLMILK